MKTPSQTGSGAQTPVHSAFAEVASNLFGMRRFYEIYSDTERVTPRVTQLHPAAVGVFKDGYVIEFLPLPAAQEGQP